MGTLAIQGYDSGGGYIPAREKPLAKHKLRSVPAPRPRIAKSETDIAFIIRESIQKAESKNGHVHAPVNEKHGGCQYGDYIFDCTDGHRALLIRGDNGKAPDYVESTWIDKPPHAILFTDSSMSLALERLEKGVGGDRFHIFTPEDGYEFALQDAVPEAEGLEYISGKSTRPIHMAFSYSYFLDCLGCWPLMMYFGDPSDYVRIEPPKATWAYILMPYRS